MIVYYAAAAIVVLALLLSIPRRPLGDILHFLAVVLSLGAAYYLVTNYSEYAYSFAAERYGITIEGKPFLLAILKASARPAMFTAAFIVCFIVIGLIFHFISIIGK